MAFSLIIYAVNCEYLRSDAKIIYSLNSNNTVNSNDTINLNNATNPNEQYKFKCINSEISCNNNGICNNLNTSCICNSNYATYIPQYNTQCNYKRKDGTLLFYLALIPWGYVPYFVINKIFLGILFLILPIIITVIVVNVTEQTDHTNTLPNNKLFKKYIIITTIITWVMNILLFYTNKVKDSNGIYPTKPFN